MPAGNACPTGHLESVHFLELLGLNTLFDLESLKWELFPKCAYNMVNNVY